MITTRALTKRYGTVTAVRSVDLDVRDGDRYGLLGPNGSGKTTLVRMLLGLVYATSGEIEVLGRRIPRHAREVLPQIGALIEEPAAYPHLSGRANLALLDGAGLGCDEAERARGIARDECPIGIRGGDVVHAARHHADHARGTAAADLAQRAPERVLGERRDHRARQLLGVPGPAVGGCSRDAELGGEVLHAEALAAQEATPREREEVGGRRRRLPDRWKPSNPLL